MRLRQKRILLTAFALLAGAMVSLLIFWQQGAIRRVLPVELGTELPPASAFVRLGLGKHAAYGEQSPEGIDTAVPGEYTVTVQALGLQREATLRVADTASPQAQPRNRVGIAGMSQFVPSDFVADYNDCSAVTAAFAYPLNLNKRGRQTVSIILQDAYGNVTKLSAKLQLLRLRDPLQFEIGKIPDSLPLTALFDEPRREEITMSYLQAPADLSRPGEQTVRILLDDYEYRLRISMADTIAPYGKPAPVKSYVGATVEPEDFFEEIRDATPVTLRFLKPPDMTREGNQSLEIELCDAAGNCSARKVKLSLSRDDEAPVITGVQDIYITKNGSIAYRKNVSVSDDSGEIELMVDSSAVDSDTPGAYEVIYCAEDPAGNITRITAYVYVSEADEAAVEALAQPVLDEILRAGMSDKEKAQAIHTWVRDHIVYMNTAEKNGIIDGAYKGFLLHQGDCYTYYALAKFMLNMQDIPSIDMRRVDSASTRHYWLLLNFGEGWYHYDPCPVLARKLHPHDGFMMTEAEAQGFGKAIRKTDYYQYDPAILPSGIVIE